MLHLVKIPIFKLEFIWLQNKVALSHKKDISFFSGW